LTQDDPGGQQRLVPPETPQKVLPGSLHVQEPLSQVAEAGQQGPKASAVPQ
jgi:hypothetical protein